MQAERLKMNLRQLSRRLRDPALIQFVKFGMVGAANTLLSYLIINASYYVFHLHEQLCNLINFLITVLVSYLLNSRFVFKPQEGKALQQSYQQNQEF